MIKIQYNEIDDCYKIFELSKHEKLDKQKLKKKYHKLCLKYHPDKNKYTNSNKFIEIKNAYVILIDYCNKENSNKENNDTITNETKIYQFLISLFNKNNLEKICNYVDKFIEKYNATTIKYIIEIDQLFNKSLFYNEEYKIYIPLWHKYIELNTIYSFLKR